MNTVTFYKRILVTTDFSGASDAALKQAVWLSNKTGASITLVHVLQTLRSPVTSEGEPRMEVLTDLGTNEGESIEDLELVARRDTDIELRRLIGRIAGSIDVQTQVLVGSSFAEIVNAVDKDGYDVVVVGTRGLAPWEEFLVGSTAKQLIRKCPSSVWIVKAEHVGQPKVVLAATDFSDVSLKAATHGFRLAQQADAAFHLLHVVDSNDVPDDAVSNIPKGSSLQQEINEEATKRMNTFVDSLSVDRSRIQVHLAWGTPWKEVSRLSQHLNADLIAMGTVGRSGILGILLGNTADKLLQSCDCSILTVKPDRSVSAIEPASRVSPSSPRRDDP